MKFVRYSLYLLSVLLPLSLLFNSKAIFYPPADWNNNLYIIGYLGASFRDHFSFPAVINASNAVGAAIPMFYGYLMYPFLGMISAFVGADLALRVGCFIMLSFQFYGLISGAKAVLKHSNLAFAIAITVTWGTYSLTNLYNRASITEYFATGFMMATISFVFAAAEQQKISGKLYFIWMAAVAAIFSLGIHPPTTFVEGLYFSALGLILIAVWVSKRPVIQLPYFIYSTIVSSLTFLMVSPWLYATLKIGPKLVQWAHPGVIIFYPDRSDTFIKRFSPLPFDWLSTQQGSVNVSTPYLEAPIDFGLLIIVLFLFWLVIKAKNNRSYSRILLIRSAPLIVVFSVLWCVFISTISLSRPFASHFLSLNTFIQFAYRLVSHINAAFLVTLFSLALINKNKGLLQARRHTLDIIASICITLAALSLYIKLPHASITNLNYTLPGGNSVRFSSSLSIEVTAAKAFRAGGHDDPFVLEPGDNKGDYVATKVKVRIIKNKATTGGYREYHLWLRPGSGLDDWISVRELARSYGLISNKGKRWIVGTEETPIKIYESKDDAIQNLVIDPDYEVLSRLKVAVAASIEEDHGAFSTEITATDKYVAGDSEIEDSTITAASFVDDDDDSFN